MARPEDLVWVTADPRPDAPKNSPVDTQHVQRNR
jgi:hypothetical protein